MVHVDFAREAFDRGAKEWDYCSSKFNLLTTPGHYFGAFRVPGYFFGNYVDVLGDLTASRIVVQVRDPRDCIISLFYSYKYSHGSPGEGILKKNFNRYLNHIEDMDIDKFALEQATVYSRRLGMITDLRDKFENHVLLNYECMVLDFKKWEKRLFGYLGIDPPRDIRKKIKLLANFEVETENINHHKRQVTPGDHKRKLRPETIEQMNVILADHLACYGYE